MIRAYLLNNQTLTHKTLDITNSTLPPNTIWLDIKCPTEEEREWMQHIFTEEVPEEDDIDEIESSSRFYVDNDGIHITSLFPQRKGRETEGANVLFTIRGSMLISFREEDVSIIRLLRHYIKHDRVEVKNNLDILLELQDIKVESLSDYIEDSYTTLEETADDIMSDDDEKINDLLQELIFQEGTITQIRLSLFDTRKALRFLRKTVSARLSPEQFESIDGILLDIESLLPHTQFLFDKINFQLQTAMPYSVTTTSTVEPGVMRVVTSSTTQGMRPRISGQTMIERAESAAVSGCPPTAPLMTPSLPTSTLTLKFTSTSRAERITMSR